MDMLNVKWWIRENVTEPLINVTCKNLMAVAEAGSSKIDSVEQAGLDVIDAVFEPTQTIKKAANWVKDHPGESSAAVVSVEAAIVSAKGLIPPMQSRSNTGVISYGKQKAGGGHDHRYSTGDDRTPAQKSASKQRHKT